MLYWFIFTFLIHGIKSSTICDSAADCTDVTTRLIAATSMTDNSRETCEGDRCTVTCDTGNDDCAVIASALIDNGDGGSGLELECALIRDSDTEYACIPPEGSDQCDSNAFCEGGFGSIAWDDVIANINGTSLIPVCIDGGCTITCIDQADCDEAKGIADALNDGSFIDNQYQCRDYGEAKICASLACTAATQDTDCALLEAMVFTSQSETIPAEDEVACAADFCTTTCNTANLCDIFTAAYGGMPFACQDPGNGQVYCLPDGGGGDCSGECAEEADCDCMQAIVDAALGGATESVSCMFGNCITSCTQAGTCETLSAAFSMTLTCGANPMGGDNICSPEEECNGDCTEEADCDCIQAAVDGVVGAGKETVTCYTPVGKCLVGCTQAGTCEAMAASWGTTLSCVTREGLGTYCDPDDGSGGGDEGCTTAQDCIDDGTTAMVDEALNATDITGETVTCMGGHCAVSCADQATCDVISDLAGSTMLCNAEYGNICVPSDYECSGLCEVQSSCDCIQAAVDGVIGAGVETVTCLMPQQDKCAIGCSQAGTCESMSAAMSTRLSCDTISGLGTFCNPVECKEASKDADCENEYGITLVDPQAWVCTADNECTVSCTTDDDCTTFNDVTEDDIVSCLDNICREEPECTSNNVTTECDAVTVAAFNGAEGGACVDYECRIKCAMDETGDASCQAGLDAALAETIVQYAADDTFRPNPYDILQATATCNPDTYLCDLSEGGECGVDNIAACVCTEDLMEICDALTTSVAGAVTFVCDNGQCTADCTADATICLAADGVLGVSSTCEALSDTVNVCRVVPPPTTTEEEPSTTEEVLDCTTYRFPWDYSECLDAGNAVCGMQFTVGINVCYINGNMGMGAVKKQISDSFKAIVDGLDAAVTCDADTYSPITITAMDNGDDAGGPPTDVLQTADECPDMDTLCGTDPDAINYRYSFEAVVRLECGTCDEMEGVLDLMRTIIGNGQINTDYVQSLLVASETEDTLCGKGFGSVGIKTDVTVELLNEQGEVIATGVIEDDSEAPQRIYYVGVVVMLGILSFLY